MSFLEEYGEYLPKKHHMELTLKIIMQFYAVIISKQYRAVFVEYMEIMIFLRIKSNRDSSALKGFMRFRLSGEFLIIISVKII